jgi:hypothetical protein
MAWRAGHPRLVSDVGVDVACLLPMLRGCDAFLACVFCQCCGFEAFSFGAG